MLEGKEVSVKIGDKGELYVDLDDKGFVEVKLQGGDLAVDGMVGSAGIKVDLLVLLEKAAAGKEDGHWVKGLLVSAKAALGR